jgi:hypothetical protein
MSVSGQTTVMCIMARFRIVNCSAFSMVPTAALMIYNRGMKPNRCAPAIFAISAIVGFMPFAAHADLLITEIMYNPIGADTKVEWVEIYNEGPYLADLSAVKFTDKSAHVLNAPPKNGGVGTMTITPGAYVVLASDATTFHTLFPNRPQVIDTTMSLHNTNGTVGLSTPKGALVKVDYFESSGGAGDGESLQWTGTMWVHAAPTPGHENAKASTVAKPVITKAVTPVKTKVSSTKTTASKTTKKTNAAAAASVSDANDPLSVVNATPTDTVRAETAAAGELSVSPWWFAAGALAVSSGAAAMMISRSKREEWHIEESE